MKEKNNKLDYFQIKDFCFTIDPMMKVIGKPQTRRRYVQYI